MHSTDAKIADSWENIVEKLQELDVTPISTLRELYKIETPANLSDKKLPLFLTSDGTLVLAGLKEYSFADVFHEMPFTFLGKRRRVAHIFMHGGGENQFALETPIMEEVGVEDFGEEKNISLAQPWGSLDSGLAGENYRNFSKVLTIYNPEIVIFHSCNPHATATPVWIDEMIHLSLFIFEAY